MNQDQAAIETEMVEMLATGREIDLTVLPEDRLPPFMRRVFDAAVRSKIRTTYTRTLMRSMHVAASKPDITGPLAGPGMIVALATQCLRTQGGHGEGLDKAALSWAQAQA